MTADAASAEDCRRLPASFEPRPYVDMGLLALAADHAIESEVRRPLPDSVCVHVSRIPSPNKFDMESLSDIAGGIEAGCSVLLPESSLSVIAYGCTSGTVVAGEARIIDTLKRLRPEAAATTPITAALAAFGALQISRVSVLTPYARDVHMAVVDYVRDRGMTVTESAYFDVGEDRRITAIAAESLSSAVDALSRSSSDAVFVSCTALRVVGWISQLERRIGKPVITSNQALAWHCLRLSGSERRIAGYGRLFEM